MPLNRRDFLEILSKGVAGCALITPKLLKAYEVPSFYLDAELNKHYKSVKPVNIRKTVHSLQELEEQVNEIFSTIKSSPRGETNKALMTVSKELLQYLGESNIPIKEADSPIISHAQLCLGNANGLPNYEGIGLDFKISNLTKEIQKRAGSELPFDLDNLDFYLHIMNFGNNRLFLRFNVDNVKERGTRKEREIDYEVERGLYFDGLLDAGNLEFFGEDKTIIFKNNVPYYYDDPLYMVFSYRYKNIERGYLPNRFESDVLLMGRNHTISAEEAILGHISGIGTSELFGKENTSKIIKRIITKVIKEPGFYFQVNYRKKNGPWTDDPLSHEQHIKHQQYIEMREKVFGK